jgi:transcriptional regulator with XRE-family HTH domain
VNLSRSDVTPEDTGARLRAVRELSGFSPAEVARSAGLSRREISAVERGRRVLSPEELRSVAGALGVDPSMLVSANLVGSVSDDTPLADRIDAVIGHDPDGWHAMPASPADLPAALPFDLPESERRTDSETRAQLEESWIAVRREMDDVVDACTRLAMCGSGDDVLDLMRKVELEIDRLTRKRSFQRHVARHSTEVLRARGNARTDTAPATPVATPVDTP